MKSKNTTRYSKYAAALAAATSAISSASAAVITFGTADLTTTATDISTNGTSVQATNLVSDNSLAGGTTIVNGVTFQNTNLFGNGYAPLNPGITIGDAADGLYSSFGYGGATTQTLTGLTIGQQYELQIFMGDNRGCCNGRSLTVGDADGDTSNDVTFAYGSGNGANGASIIGTFTADATTQNFFVTISTASSAELSAFQLRDITPVPEPSSTALIGLGGLALILRRRK